MKAGRNGKHLEFAVADSWLRELCVLVAEGPRSDSGAPTRNVENDHRLKVRKVNAKTKKKEKKMVTIIWFQSSSGTLCAAGHALDPKYWSAVGTQGELQIQLSRKGTRGGFF